MNLQKAQSKEDAEKIAALGIEIWHECYAEILSAAQIDYALAKFQSSKAVQGQIANEGYEYYLVLEEGGFAGYLAYKIEDERLFISKVYLLAAFRGRGLAKKVFGFLEETAKQNACKALWLTVNKNNARAIAAYKKSGYATVSAQVTDIGKGYVMDDFVMEKAL